MFAHVGGRTISSWAEVGLRVAEARASAGLTQDDVARQSGLDVGTLVRIESGQREVDASELSRLARVLQRPVTWFVSVPAASLTSRRSALDHRQPHRIDARLEDVAAGVEFLLREQVLRAEPFRVGFGLRTVADAEAAARATRAHLDTPEEPLWPLARAAEDLGLFTFSLELTDGGVDGAYAALDSAGVAVINGAVDSGRRRFTLAHEIGHHVLQDEFSTDWDIVTGADERERLINAFAIHLLMPRPAVVRDWQALKGDQDPWVAALTVGGRFGVSWSALCAQLKNLGLVDQRVYDDLASRPPIRADYLEHELVVADDLRPPHVPPGFAAAVLKAYRTQHIGRGRAVELLHGTLRDDELPPMDRVPLAVRELVG